MARGRPTPGDKVELVKALKLLNPEMSQRDIAREAKMSKTTVQNILANLEDDEEFRKFREEKKREQIAKALDIASTYIDHLKNPEVIAKASARDSAIVAGTMIDKAQLLAGEPTIISQSTKSLPDLVKDTEKMLQELKQLTG